MKFDMTHQLDKQAQMPFSIAAQSAASSFDLADTLELLTPFILSLEKFCPYENSDPVLYTTDMHDLFGRLRGLSDAKNGNFRNGVTDLQRMQYLIDISDILDFVLSESEDDDFYRLRGEYPFLQSAYNLVTRAIDFSSYKFNIDLVECFDRKNVLIAPAESMFPPRENLEFLAAYTNFIKTEVACHLAGNNKRSAGGIKSYFSRAANPWKKTNHLQHEDVVEGLSKFSEFYSKAKSILEKSGKTPQSMALYQMLEACEKYAGSFVANDNQEVKRSIPESGAQIIRFAKAKGNQPS